MEPEDTDELRRRAAAHAPGLESVDMDPVAILRQWAEQVRRFTRSTAVDSDDYSSPFCVAQRFRAVCREHGPFEVAAAVGAPQNVDPERDLRTISYLLAHKTASEDVLEICVEQGIYGLREWLEAR